MLMSDANVVAECIKYCPNRHLLDYSFSLSLFNILNLRFVFSIYILLYNGQNNFKMLRFNKLVLILIVNWLIEDLIYN